MDSIADQDDAVAVPGAFKEDRLQWTAHHAVVVRDLVGERDDLGGVACHARAHRSGRTFHGQPQALGLLAEQEHVHLPLAEWYQARSMGAGEYSDAGHVVGLGEVVAPDPLPCVAGLRSVGQDLGAGARMDAVGPYHDVVANVAGVGKGDVDTATVIVQALGNHPQPHLHTRVRSPW